MRERALRLTSGWLMAFAMSHSRVQFVTCRRASSQSPVPNDRATTIVYATKTSAHRNATVKHAILIALLVAPSAHAQSIELAAELGRVETMFSDAARANGVRAAFLQYLDSSAVIFRDGRPVNAPAWYAAQADGPELLQWRPTSVHVSNAGDLGVSTGPWAMHATRSDTAVAARGTYLTIWRRIDNRWKAVLDYGVRRPAAPAAADSGTLELQRGGRSFALETSGTTHKSQWPGRGARAVLDGGVRRQAKDARDDSVPIAPPLLRPAAEKLLRLDSSLAASARTSGAAAVLGRLSDTSTMTLRWLTAPGKGRASRENLFPGEPGALTWTPSAAFVAESEDLGYTYGVYVWQKGTAVEAGHYVRVFRREDSGAWRILVDVHRPHPPQRP